MFYLIIMRNRKIHIFLASLIFAISLVCCQDDATDNIIIEKDVPAVNTIDVFDDINIILYPGTTYRINIDAPEDLIDNIIADTVAGSLHIKNNNKFNWMHYLDSVKVHVFFGNGVVIIHTHGTGSVSTFDTLTSDYIRFYAFNGGGIFKIDVKANTVSLISHSYTTTDFTISGTANALSSHAKGMGKIKLENLLVKKADIIYNGTNEYFINVSEELKVNLLNAGNVYCYGNPDSINLSMEGEGKLILLE